MLDVFEVPGRQIAVFDTLVVEHSVAGGRFLPPVDGVAADNPGPDRQLGAPVGVRRAGGQRGHGEGRAVGHRVVGERRRLVAGAVLDDLARARLRVAHRHRLARVDRAGQAQHEHVVLVRGDSGHGHLAVRLDGEGARRRQVRRRDVEVLVEGELQLVARRRHLRARQRRRGIGDDGPDHRAVDPDHQDPGSTEPGGGIGASINTAVSDCPSTLAGLAFARGSRDAR